MFETQVDKVFNLFWFGSFWDWYFWEFSTKIQVDRSKSRFEWLLRSPRWGRTRLEDVQGLRTNLGSFRGQTCTITMKMNRTHFITKSKYSFWGFLLQMIILTYCSRDRALTLSFEFIESIRPNFQPIIDRWYKLYL